MITEEDVVTNQIYSGKYDTKENNGECICLFFSKRR
jgi:hypothetical protein